MNIFVLWFFRKYLNNATSNWIILIFTSNFISWLFLNNFLLSSQLILMNWINKRLKPFLLQVLIKNRRNMNNLISNLKISNRINFKTDHLMFFANETTIGIFPFNINLVIYLINFPGENNILKDRFFELQII